MYKANEHIVIFTSVHVLVHLYLYLPHLYWFNSLKKKHSKRKMQSFLLHMVTPCKERNDEDHLLAKLHFRMKKMMNFWWLSPDFKGCFNLNHDLRTKTETKRVVQGSFEDSHYFTSGKGISSLILFQNPYTHENVLL